MRLTVNNIKEMKLRDEKISMLTAYDHPTARILDEAGIPVILVGDSLGQVVLGYDSTIYVTMEDMIHHIKAVARGSHRSLVVGDMPFMSYQLGISETLKNAGRIIQEGGAQAVKLEGGEDVAETVHRIVQCGIPVMGHIGLIPQSIYQLGGYKVQGKTPKAAAQLLRDAQALVEAGVFSIVLELVPAQLARLITRRSSVPTIGIGAGKDCDGQVQVINDMVGLFTDFVPKHAKAYASLAGVIKEAVTSYMQEVSSGIFPSDRESYNINEEILAEFLTHSQTS